MMGDGNRMAEVAVEQPSDTVNHVEEGLAAVRNGCHILQRRAGFRHRARRMKAGRQG